MFKTSLVSVCKMNGTVGTDQKQGLCNYPEDKDLDSESTVRTTKKAG